MTEKVDPTVEKEIQRQFEILTYGTAEIVPVDEFKAVLRKSISTNTPLRVKCGIDPTAPDVHLGHLVPYRKMRQFQDLGHIGVVIIGDYTASIGDPTGKNESRPGLSREDIEKNAQSYMEQVYTVLDKDRTEIRWQTEWFEKITLRDVISWAAETTVAKLLSHDTFKIRIDAGNPLCLHEVFYPVLQGIDSVYVNADIELGGTDQRFNVLMGRDYQKNRNMNQQVAILLPIVLGTCGTAKMSKSLGNYIGIKDEPFDKFGKIMSIPDKLMDEYFKYIANVSALEFQKIKSDLQNGVLHPNEAKKQLATKVVAFFHGNQIAKEMREKFESIFAKGNVPNDAPEMELSPDDTLISILTSSGLFQSNAEIRRLVKQNAVGIVNGEKLTDLEIKLDKSFKNKTIKIGKRKFIKLI